MLRGSFEKQKQEANKLNESAIEYSILKRDLDSNRTLYEGLLEKLKEAGVTAGLRSNNFRIIDAARVPTSPSEPNIPRNLSFALVLGVISGVGLAFLLENMDNTVRTPEQAQAISALPSLGMIPLGSKSAQPWTDWQAAGFDCLQGSGGDGNPGSPAVADGRILSRAADFASALQSRSAAQSHHGDQRPSAGRQDHDQHQHRDRARAKGSPRSPDRRRLAPPQYSQDSGHGPAQRSQQRADRKRHPAADHHPPLRSCPIFSSCPRVRRLRIPPNCWRPPTCGTCSRSCASSSTTS